MAGRPTRVSTTSSRYQQEYPPPQSPKHQQENPHLRTPITIRRASSESKLDVLNKADNIKRLQESVGKENEKSKVNDQSSSGPKTTQESQEDQEHFNLEFDVCIQEHEHNKTFPKLFGCLGISYKYTKFIVYYIFVILIGVPMTFVWAFINGVAIFNHVWIWGPILKLILFCVHCCAPVITTPIQVVCTPLVDVSARIFRQIRIQTLLIGQPTPALEKYPSQIHLA